MRENNSELRELEAKLRAAYVTKELSAQIAEKEYLKLKQKMAENEANEIMKHALLSEGEIDRQKAEEEIKRKAIYKKELQDQIIIKYQESQSKYEDFLREKKMLDDIIQRIHDEDQR